MFFILKALETYKDYEKMFRRPFIASPGKVKTKAPTRIIQSIPSSQYAEYCSRVKPRCRINQQKMKRLKKKMWRKFAKQKLFVGRIQTHNAESDRMKLWKEFQENWYSLVTPKSIFRSK